MTRHAVSSSSLSIARLVGPARRRFHTFNVALTSALATSLLFPCLATADISLVDTGTSFYNTTQASDNTFTVSPGANVLVVNLAWRSGTSQNGGLGTAPALTYNGVTLNAASLAYGNRGTYTDSAIFYLYAPTTGSALDLHIDAGVGPSDVLADVYTLGGVDLTQRPELRAGWSTFTNTDDSQTNPIAASLSNLPSGAWAVSTANFRAGSTNLLTGSLTAGTGTLVTSGTGGSPANGNFYDQVTPSNRLVVGDALVSNVTTSNLTIQELAGSIPNTHYQMAAAAFAAAGVGAIPSYTWTGSATSNWNTTDSNWSGAGSTYTEPSTVTFNDSGNSTNPIVIQGGGVSPTLVTFANNANTYTLGGGAITGAAKVYVGGSGSVVLNGANTYTGATTVGSGTLQLGNANSVQNSTLTAAGGTVTFGSGITTFNVGGLAGKGSINLADTASLPVTLVVGANGASSTFAGSLTGSGGVTKSGAGTVTLSGTNSYSGPTKITNGTLRVFAPGLNEGFITGNAFDTTSANPSTSVQLTPRYAGFVDGNPYNGTFGTWQDNSTYAYSGYINNAGGSPVTWTFFEHFDDNVDLKIDGHTVLHDTAWNNPTTANYTLTPGRHSFELRLGEGGGGVGPALGDGSWATNSSLGFGIDPQGRNQQNALNYVPLIDPGDGSLFSVANANTVMSSASQVIMSSGTTFDITGEAVTIGSLVDAAGASGQQVLVGSGTLTTGGDNSNTTFSGVISGVGGSLVKNGTGTFKLTAVNTLSGTTTINSGVLELDNVNALQNSTVNVTGGGAIAFFGAAGSTFNLGGIAGTGTINMANTLNQTINLTIGGANANSSFAGVLSGGGNLTKIGTGTILMSGANTYTGTTTLSGGTLAADFTELAGVSGPFGAANSVGSILFNGGTLQYTANNGANDYSNRFSVNAQPYKIDINGQLVTFANNMGTGTGSSSLTLTDSTGGGVLTLTPTTANAFAGGVNLNGGTLSLGNAGAIGSTGAISFAGGTLQYTASNTTDYVTRFNATAANQVSIDLNGQNITYNTPYTSVGGSLRVSDSTFAHGGTLTLNTANTHSGPTTIASGALQINNANSLQNSTATLLGGSLVFGPGVGTFNVGGLAGTGDSSGNLSLVDTNSQPVSLVIGATGSGGLYSGNVTGGGTLTKVGASTQAFGNPLATASIAPPVNVTAGTLRVGTVPHVLAVNVYSNNGVDNAQFTTLGAMNWYLSGATLAGTALTSDKTQLDYSNNGYGGPNAIFGTAGPTTGNYGVSASSNVMAHWSGLINITTAGNYVFSSTSDDGSLVWIDGGNGVTPNNGQPAVNNNFFQGATTRSSGSIPLTPGLHRIDLGFYQGGGGEGVLFAYNGPDTGNVTQTIPASVLSAATSVTMSQVVMSSNTTFDIGPSSATIGSLADAAGNPTGHQVTLNGGSLTTGTDNSNTTFSGAISGSGAFTKTGTGTFTLASANSYSGSATITGGTLQINNANSLQGATVNVAGGTLAFGTGPSTFNLGGITGSGAINMANIASGTVNLTVGGNNQSTTYTGQLTGSGSLTKTGTGTLTMAGSYASAQPIAITGGTLRVGSGNGLKISIYDTAPNNADNNQFNALSTLNAYLAGPTVKQLVVAQTTDKTNMDYSDQGYGDNAMFGILGPTTGNYGYGPWNQIAAHWNGQIKIATAGTYQFRTTSDDGSMVWLDGNDTPVVNNNFYQGATTRGGSIAETAGLHQIDLAFYEGGGGNGVLFEYNGPDTGNNWVTIPNNVLFPNEALTAPFTSNAVPIVMSSNTTFDVSPGSISGVLDIGSLADAAGNPSGHQVLLGSNTLRTGNDNSNTTFSGAIHGAGGSVVKVGSGAFTLAGLSDYSGPTTVSNGKVILASGSGLGNTAISVASGATLAPHPNNNATISTGAAASLALASGSTFDMSGDLNGGTFSVGGGLSMTGPLSLKFDIGTDGTGATVVDKLAVGGTATDTGTASVTITGFGSNNLHNGQYPLITANSGLTSGSFTLTNSTVVVNGTTYNLSLISTAAAEKLRVAGQGTVGSWIQTGSGSFSWGDGTNWASGQIPGAAGDTATFGAANANNQTVTLDQSRALGLLIFNNSGGGSYNISSGTFTLSLDAQSAGAAVSNLTGNNTISAAVSVNDTTLTTIDASLGTSLTLSGVVSGSGPLTIGSIGGGTVALSNAANSFSGPFTIAGGTVQVPSLNNASTNGPLGNQASITLGTLGNSIGTIEYAGGNLSTNMPFVMGTGGGGSFKIDSAATALTLSGNITGSGSLGTSGPGTLVLSGSGNTFSGGLNINGGTVRASNANSGVIGSGNVTFGAAGTTLDLNGNSPTTGFLSSTGGNGLVTNNGGSTSTLTLSSAGLASFSGSINKGTSDISLVVTGGGGQEFTGASNFTGNVAIQNGALQIGAGGSLAPTNSVTLGNGTTSGALSLGNGSGPANLTVSGLSVSGTGGSNRVVGGASTVSTLTINNTSPVTYANTLFGTSGTNRNNLAIALGPTSTISLTGDNSYNGGTTIPAGATLNIGAPTVLLSTPAGTGPLQLSGGALNLQGRGQGSLGITIYNMNPGDQANQFDTLAHLQAYLATGTPSVTTQTIDKTNLDYSDMGYGDNAMFNIAGPTTGNYGFTPNNNITAHWTGDIKITQGGTYQFRTTSDDGSMVWLDNVNTPVVNNNFYQGPTTRGGSVNLANGFHQIDLGFYEGGGGNGVLFEYNGPDTGNNWVTIPTSVLEPTLAGPTTTSPNQSYVNPVVVSANSTINITNSLTATTGPASLGNVTLNVTSSDGTANPYSLTFSGASTLTGNATINVNSSAGGGTGRVNISSVGETGGSHSLTKTGPGVLSLSGQGNYSGGTVLAASTGLVIANNGGSLGTGSVTLNNATTLRVIASGNFSVKNAIINGFNGGTGWAPSNDGGTGVNVPAFSGNTLTLTNSQNDERRSVFYNTPVDVNKSFAASFTYQATNGSGNPADGAAFILQNDPALTAALGGGGGQLGYGGIQNSVAYQLSLYHGNPTNGSQFQSGGTINTSGYTSTAPVNLLANGNGGNPVSVVIVWDNSDLSVTENLTDTVTGDTFTKITPVGVDLPSLVGQNTALLGFSGATGGENSTQTISNFQFGYSSVTSNYGNNIVVTPASNSTIEVQGSTLIKATMGSLSVGGGGTLNKIGTGGLEVTGPSNLAAGAVINVTSGSLKFTNNAGPSTVAAGVIANVSTGATLELAGSVSSLSDPSGATKRVHVINNATQADSPPGGLLVSGSHQQVGAVDGTGDTVVQDNASLTANHIVQNALVIGGSAGNPAVVTIAASDSSGNSLAEAGGLALTGSLNAGTPLTSGASSSLLTGGTSVAGLGNLGLGGGGLGTGTASVPEPSTLVLVGLGALAGSLAFIRRRSRKSGR